MKVKTRNNGSVFLVTVFVIALLAALTMGMLQINTEEIQLMRNQIYAAQALATAEAGLNDAFAEIRADSSWTTGFVDKSFLPTLPPPGFSGSYTVTVTGSLPNRTITSTGTTGQGFIARVAAKITVGTSSPYIIRIDELRINE
ncbi:MAG: hypothetical protein ACYS1A_00985 [Planctomycetota bacterium]|jgi:Tfp pilus assembly protein PilX